MNRVENLAYISRNWDDLWIRQTLQASFETRLNKVAISWLPDRGFI